MIRPTFRLLLIIQLCCCLCSLSGVARAAAPCDEAKKKPLAAATTLRVALYPFTPDRFRLFQLLEAEYECLFPGLNVELVEDRNAGDRYYDSDDAKKRGFKYVSADVYEIDTILLSDFIDIGKIAPISLPFDDFDADAIKAVTRGNTIYAVPHWLCGNFLFYRRSDADIENAETWSALAKVLSDRQQGLFADLKGGLTLGEWYLTVLSDLTGVEAAQLEIMSSDNTNVDALDALKSILTACPTGYCRSQLIHDEKVGFYPRAFVRGQISSYVGYSESLHYGLRERVENCSPGTGCLREADIAVRRLPVTKPGSNSKGLGWVDGLAIDTSLTGDKKDIAVSFIKFATESETYKKLLTPEWPNSSRYLLAARPVGPIDNAPLYDAFYAAYRGRETGMLKGLNEKLRKLAKQKIDCELPKERGDDSCKQ